MKIKTYYTAVKTYEFELADEEIKNMTEDEFADKIEDLTKKHEGEMFSEMCGAYNMDYIKNPEDIWVDGDCLFEW